MLQVNASMLERARSVRSRASPHVTKLTLSGKYRALLDFDDALKKSSARRPSKPAWRMEEYHRQAAGVNQPRAQPPKTASTDQNPATRNGL
jgi:hypothetical protein